MNSYDFGIDINGLNLLASKIEFFNIEEKKIDSSICSILKGISKMYDSDNSDLIDTKENEIYNKLLLFEKNHNNCLEILRKNQEKYSNVASEIKDTFNKLAR